MALDGIFLKHLCKELNLLSNNRIEKIYQPSRDELVLQLRSVGFSGKLLISAKSGFSRICLTDDSYDNPADPPTFCKLMRKYIGGAKIVDFRQQGLDRTLFIRFSCYNEMGDLIFPYLAVELFANRSNIILCEESGRIIDAIHRSDIESGTRLIQPGAKYEPLLPPEKLDPFNTAIEDLAKAVIATKKPAASAFMAAIDGVSPLISRELAERAGLDGDAPPCDEDLKSIVAALENFKKIITFDHLPTLITTENEASDFSYMAAVTQYKNYAVAQSVESYNALLNEYYSLRDRASRLKAQSADMTRLLNNIHSRITRRLSARVAELQKSRDREELRIYGELLKANLYAVPKGASSVQVQNYYDPELKSVEIPLNPALTPSANAAKYFKDYKKAHTAEFTLTKLIEEDEKELSYIDSVIDSLSRAENLKEITEIREELFESGYIFRVGRAKKPKTISEPKQVVGPHGFRIAVGRNNHENDVLTLKTADKDDIWLHAKDIPGSHVIIFTEGLTPPDETLIFAAKLAAKNSKAAGSSNIPVDYTLAKHVKKPSGAKPGMVIYTHNHTVYVTP